MTTSAVSSDVGPSAPSRWLIPVCALIGLVLGLVLYQVRTPTYEGVASVTVSNPAGTLTQEAAVVISDEVITAATATLGFEPAIEVEPNEIAGLLTITASADSAIDAAQAANVVASTYAQSQTTAAIGIAERALAPTSAAGPGRIIYALLGSAAGAALGVVVGSIRNIRRRSVAPDPVAERVAERRRRAAEEPTELGEPILVAGGDETIRFNPGGLGPAEADAATMFSEVSLRPDSAGFAPAAPGSPSGDQPAPPVGDDEPWQTPSASTEAWSDEELFVSPPSLPEEVDSTTPVLSGAPSGATFSVMSGVSTEEEVAAQTDEATIRRDLERATVRQHYESALYEVKLEHQQSMAHLQADHERLIAQLRGENAELGKRVRAAAAQLKRQAGNDEHRVGDLQAQVDLAEEEVRTLREQLERHRIGSTRKLTEEQSSADRSLDNARREHQQDLAKHLQIHRNALAEQRRDLDTTLAAARAEHATELETQHTEHEAAIEAERARRDTELVAMSTRHRQELDNGAIERQTALRRQAEQYKETIRTLRTSQNEADTQITELQRAVQQFRAEIAALRKQGRQEAADHSSNVQAVQDQLALTRTELEAERDRNRALRADVLKRSADSHQMVDRELASRNAELAKLEAAMTRQRDYAEERVREVATMAEERAREAAVREAEMTAEISRLRHELSRRRGPEDA